MGLPHSPSPPPPVPLSLFLRLYGCYAMECVARQIIPHVNYEPTGIHTRHATRHSVHPLVSGHRHPAIHTHRHTRTRPRGGQRRVRVPLPLTGIIHFIVRTYGCVHGYACREKTAKSTDTVTLSRCAMSKQVSVVPLSPRVYVPSTSPSIHPPHKVSKRRIWQKQSKNNIRQRSMTHGSTSSTRTAAMEGVDRHEHTTHDTTTHYTGGWCTTAAST